jgi:hypothetical protein
MHCIRGKLSYSNVVATLCLVLVVGGGTAYAASELDRESVDTKQLAKEAVTPSKLSKASKKTLTGKEGPSGAVGATGAPGAPGLRGERGEPGPFRETLPSGKTETGIYAFSGRRASFYPGAAVSFAVPLASEPTVRVNTGTPTTDCPGSAEKPTAAPGILCIYEQIGPNLATFPVGPGYRAGFFFLSHSLENSETEVYGSWAVTAP